MQQQLAAAEMGAIRDELADARNVTAQLESKNADLGKQAVQSLGREGDLKQSLNVSKSQVNKLERSLRDAQVRIGGRSTAHSQLWSS